MSTTSTQYLLYASLVLGSIGTYNALKDGMAQQPGAGGDNFKLGDDIADLSASMSAVESFLDSFNNKSTSLHAELADVHAALSTLNSFESSSESSVDVDSTYVRNLSKRISLVETSNTSSKEAAFEARDTSVANKASLASLKSVVDGVTQQISATRVTSGEVAQLAEQVNSGMGGNHDFTAMDSRVNGLTRESEALATRLVGVETWVQGRKNASLNVTADAGSAAVSQATLDNITDLQSAVDLNTTNIETLIIEVDTNTDNISLVSTGLQEQITQNKSNTNAVKTTADGLVSDMNTLHLPRISDIEAKVLALTDMDTSTGTRLDLVEGEVPLAQAARGILTDDLVSLSERVTKNTNSIGDIEDDLDGAIQEDIDAAKARLTVLEGDASHLSEKLKRSGDYIICDGVLRTEEAELSLSNNPIKLGSSSSTDWMIWAGGKMEINGKNSANGYDFTGENMTVRVRDNSQSGFVLENSNAERLFSVRGNDGLGWVAGPMRVDERAYVYSESSTAYFSNFFKRSVPAEMYALAHADDGTTTLNSDNLVKIRVQKADRLEVKSHYFKIFNSGSNVQHTFFQGNSNHNYISTASGKRTYFRFGNDGPSVSILHKEININGTNVLAKLNALEKRIKSLEDDDTIKNKDIIYLKNGNNNKYVRKGDDDNNIVVDKDKGKVGTRDRFTLERR